MTTTTIPVEEVTIVHPTMEDTNQPPVAPVEDTNQVIYTTPLDNINDLIVSFANSINESKKCLNDLKDLKRNFSQWAKVNTTKKGRKKSTKDPNKVREPHGITKPTNISDELAKFLDLPEGDLYPRVAITSKIHDYAKLHNIKCPEDKRNIDLTSEHGLKLKKLLRIEDEKDILNMFQIQKYLKCHFPPSKASLAAQALEDAKVSEDAKISEDSKVSGDVKVTKTKKLRKRVA